MMRTTALLLALAFFAGCTSDSLDYPQIADPTPWDAPRDDRITTDSGLDTLPLGDEAALVFTLPGFTLFAWTLEVPPGSTATLSDAGAASPTFTPDVAGDYGVTVTAMDPVAMTTEVASRRLYAGTYIGEPACAQCHPDTEMLTRFTDHAGAFSDNGSILFVGAPGCFTCHVLDPIPNPPPAVAGSFTAVSASEGLDPATYTYTNFSDFEDDFPQTATLASVQCENCHGPGSQHNSDPRRISVPLRETGCATCHSGVVGPDIAAQWASSAHGDTPPGVTVRLAQCQRCHTARVFIDNVNGDPPQEITAGAPGVTCAACHDPHDATNAEQVRVFGAVPLTSGGSYDAGRAAACLLCHQSDVADPIAHANANERPPFATQADMIATRGAIEFGAIAYGNSFHARTTFRLRPFTGDPDDSDTSDSCVICHMAPAPAGPLANDLGEHSMRLRDGATELATGNCTRCHPATFSTFDVVIGDDFDGDGLVRGVQTEIRGLMEILASAIDAADVNGAVSQPGGPGTPIRLDADPALSTPTLRQAVYNYNFAAIDGSFGIHNTTYVVQVLQRTYEPLTGVPFSVAFPDADVR